MEVLHLKIFFQIGLKYVLKKKKRSTFLMIASLEKSLDLSWFFTVEKKINLLTIIEAAYFLEGMPFCISKN